MLVFKIYIICEHVCVIVFVLTEPDVRAWVSVCVCVSVSVCVCVCVGVLLLVTKFLV